MAVVIVQVGSKKQKWRGGTTSRDIYEVNDDQDLIISGWDMKRLRKECGVTPMFLSSWGKWCHSPREGLLDKRQFWRRMGVDSVSGRKKGRKEAMIFGVLLLSTHLKVTSLLKKQGPKGRIH